MGGGGGIKQIRSLSKYGYIQDREIISGEGGGYCFRTIIDLCLSN